MYDEDIPGSSPHTRGARFAAERARLDGGIIPAYAGSTTRRQRRSASPRDHPRIRGEHAASGLWLTTFSGSSPHTRGALEEVARVARVAGIIPAYAGSTAHGMPTITRARDHPRIRGEHSAQPSSSLSSAGSSPHTRGAPLGILRQGGLPGTIPAYAGSTLKYLVII